jgi:hypothetical protein
VVSQTILNATVVESDVFEFVSGLGYQFDYEYWTRSYEFVFGDVVLKLYRLCVKDEDNGSKEISAAGDQTVGDFSRNVLESSTIDEPMSLDANDDVSLRANIYNPLKLVDSSGRWAVKAYVDVRQLTDPEMVSATSQLEKFQTDISALFDLTVPDRNSFDTRIRR